MRNNDDTKVEGTAENWESELLGNDERFAQIAADVTGKGADDMLALQAISIRLQKSLIRDLKMIAEENGLKGYQPLIRRVLQRFADCELKKMAREAMSTTLNVSVEPEENDENCCQHRMYG